MLPPGGPPTEPTLIETGRGSSLGENEMGPRPLSMMPSEVQVALALVQLAVHRDACTVCAMLSHEATTGAPFVSTAVEVNTAPEAASGVGTRPMALVERCARVVFRPSLTAT